ncbi:MAG: TonB-dependent receptor [Reichenbachiella sp.]
MLRKSFMILVVMLTSLTWVSGQDQISISGKVTGPDRDELPGVNVLVQGTANGVVTDIDGNYFIELGQDATLVFSFIGYKSQTINIAGRSIINVQLEVDVQSLDEIIVIGYGESTKRGITAAISKVDGEDFQARSAPSVSDALSGMVAGVQVSSNGGAPGTESNVLIRGVSTLNNNSPQYVVDGQLVDDIEFLNPKNIESIQVLKDAAAAAIYGSRGSNGVIIVVTKQGKVGQTTIDVNAKYSVQSAAKSPNMANATEYALIRNAATSNDGGAPPYNNPQELGAGTNWWEYSTQVAPIQDYNISASKGTEDFKISSNIGYFDQEGIVKGGGYERLTFNLNTTYELSNSVTVGQNFTMAYSKYENGPGLVWDAMRIEPVTSPLLPDYEQVGRYEFSIYSPTITDVPNVAGQLARNFSTTDYKRSIGNIFIDIHPFESISLKSSVGFYLSNWEDNSFEPDYYIEPNDFRQFNSVARSHNNKTNYVVNNILTFAKTYGDHDVTVMAGNTIEKFTHQTLSGSGENTPNNHPDLRYLDVTTSAFNVGGRNDEPHSQLSFLSRVMYEYKSKYQLSGSFRYDGSSVFPEKNRWAPFFSLSGGWVLTEEDFFDLSAIDFLKIRASWGQIGNQEIYEFAKITEISPYQYALGVNQDIELAAAPSTIGNDNLKWETVEDVNLGIDIELLDNALAFTFDAYQRNTKDMLMQKSVPLYIGGGFETPWSNVGTMQTRGMEFSVGYNNSKGDFKYSIGVNGSHSKSQLISLAEGEAIWDGNHQRLDLLGYSAEGQAPGQFYGYVTDGVFQNQQEASNYTDFNGNRIQPNARPGDFRFKDLDGNGMINADDRMVIGNPEPILTYGINLGLKYKGLSLSMLFTGKLGGDVLNALSPYASTGAGDYNSFAGLYESAWDGEGTSNTQPRLTNTDANQNFRYSNYYIQDGSYFRMKNVQLAYDLPNQWVEKLSMTRCQVFVSGENLLTITGYDGLDPDIGGSATLRGVDWGNYPLPRILSAGINVSFNPQKN